MSWRRALARDLRRLQVALLLMGLVGSAAAPIRAAPAPTQTWVDPAHRDIPPAYRGVWVLDPKSCGKEANDDGVEIGSRTISFYESYGFLELAQLNEIKDPPVFYGSFKFAGELNFWSETIRLELAGSRLVISHIKDKEDPSSDERWTRCPRSSAK